MGIGRPRRTARAIRLAAVGVAALGLALAGASCTGDSTEADDEALTAPELRWLRAYSAWTIAVYDDELGPPPGQRLVEACTTRLEGVGPPPSERLEPTWERAAAACPLLARPGSVRRANDVVEAADDLVLPFFLDEQSLPLNGTPTETSRADLWLSAVASRASDSHQEVRCWTLEDWRRLVDEENAWMVQSDDAEELYGWQDGDTDRIHMRLRQCNVLHRLGRENVLAWKRADQVEAADSVVTLAHEIQHLLLPDAGEAEVECAAAETIGAVARRMGATAGEASRLAALYVTDIRDELPDEYLSSCDGAFD